MQKDDTPAGVAIDSTPLFDADLSQDGYVLTVERGGCGDMTLYKDEAVTLMRILEAWTPRMIQFRPPSNSCIRDIPANEGGKR